jgi:hypothetical protein
VERIGGGCGKEVERWSERGFVAGWLIGGSIGAVAIAVRVGMLHILLVYTADERWEVV